jgi:adenosylcobyric acid synthase
VQAEASGLLPTVHMNPILLKPSSNLGSQVILHGKVFGQMDARNYHDFKPKLRQAVLGSYSRLAGDHDIIVLEGAGSCCEMNLKKNDLVNFFMAKAVGAPCLLVADIDRGGVFAQIIGSYQLMTRREKQLVVGFLINKFRGDPLLFESGIDYIERKTLRPVLGLIPFYRDIYIDSEDSVGVQEDKWHPKTPCSKSINVAVLKLPTISNFTDLAILEREEDIVLNYLFKAKDLSSDYDLLILPGTKNVMEDSVWLMGSGWKRATRAFIKKGGRVFGICGGFQLLGEKICDPAGMESNIKKVNGLGLLPVETILEEEKLVRKVVGTTLTDGTQVRGYEIHMGRSRILRENAKPYLRIHVPGKRHAWNDGCFVNDGRITGTYVHGIFDAPSFRGAFLNKLRREKGQQERSPKKGRLTRFKQYDLLADHFEAHCDVDKILTKL